MANKRTTGVEIPIKATDQTGKGVASAKQKVGGLTKAVKAYGAEIAAAYLAVRKAYKIVQDLTEAWGVQEISVIELNNALQNTGIFTPMLSDELQDLAKYLQSTTTYGDELTLSAIAMLQSLGELDEEMLKRAIPAVQDLATSLFKGDMNTAASMFAKVVGSSTNALSRYGIEIDMTGSKTEKFEEIMTKVNLKFGGRSAELADSYTGKMKQLKNSYGDLREAMGHVMANQMEPSIPLMMEITTQLTDWINHKIALKEAYEDIKRPMEDANDQTRIEIVQAKQLIAIETLRILLADTQDAQYTVMGLDLKTMNAERDKEISRLQAIISGSERELKAIMDLIAARDTEARKEDERKKKLKETKATMDELIATSDEWKNTIIYSGEALDNYIEQLESARASQAWLNEETEGAIENTGDYEAAMRRLEDRARLLEQEIPEVTDRIAEMKEAALETAELMEGQWSRSWEIMGDSAMSGAEKIKAVMGSLFSDLLRMLGKKLLVLAAEAFVPGLSFNPLAGAGYLAASAMAYAGAGYIQSLKTGGITKEETVAHLHPNEAVIPLDSPQGRQIMGPTVIVHIYGSVLKEKDVAQSIAMEIKRQGYSVA